MYIEISDETGQVSQDLQQMLLGLLEEAAKHIGQEGEEMAVTFVDNARIQAINREYRNIDHPTDVVSLEYKPESPVLIHEADMVEDPHLADILAEYDSYIGTLYISIDKAKEQADAYGHSYERELGFLAVHGFLHISGYDHKKSADEKEMFTLQEEILTAYGLTRESE